MTDRSTAEHDDHHAPHAAENTGRRRGLFGNITSGVVSGATSILAPTADVLKSGASLAHDATKEGLSIGQKITHSGLDMGSNVATGTATLAGTAVSGVVTAAAETSGAVFTPTADVLKSGASIAQSATKEGLSIGQKVTSSGLDMGSNVATGTAALAGTALSGVVTAAAETSGDVFTPTANVLKSSASLAHDATKEGLSLGQKITYSGLDMGSNVATGTATLAGTALGGVVTTSGALLTPTADMLKSGATLARDATVEGISISQKIAHSGLDMGSNVVTGTASFAGTALGGVVTVAAETSGAVFEPVGSGLKAIQSLDALGQGIEAINGLPLGAVRQVSQLTSKALNMSGKTPTFFDQDADGIVTVPDTVRGLVLLGLDEKNATYAAYALHAVFSYSTSDSWVPHLDKKLPIHVARMGRTRLGRNWGSFERIEWVDDVEIDEFFDEREKTLSDYLRQGRQGLGIGLLFFEWSTTWPFYMPPVPVHVIPFSDDIGMVIRKAILPTILLNFKKAKEAKPDSGRKSYQVSFRTAGIVAISVLVAGVFISSRLLK